MKKTIMAVLVLAAVAGIYANTNGSNTLAVSAVQVARGDVVASVTNTRAGTVNACRRAGLAPSTGGNITGLYVKDGDSVEQGQLLIELWNADFKAQLMLAELVSVAIGLVAGVVPASHAARMDPLEALRTE